MNNQPFVSVIMAVRNEEKFIEESMGTILDQDYPADKMEIIVADGISEDRTREKIERMAQSGIFLKIIDNPGRIISTGLNAAIEAARGEVIIRVDGHTFLATDYVRRCVEVLQATGAINVGGAWRAFGKDRWGSAIAEVFQSSFVFGSPKSRNVHYEGSADTVYLGCWRKETLQKLGGFDPGAVRNEDTELNKRIRSSGGIVWQSPAICSKYFVLSDPLKYFKQWAGNGYWMVRTLRKHPSKISLRHWLLMAGILGAATILIAGGFKNHFNQALLSLLAAYLFLNIFLSLDMAFKKNLRHFPFYFSLIFLTHAGYVAGFLCGFVDFVLLRGNFFLNRFSKQVIR